MSIKTSKPLQVLKKHGYCVKVERVNGEGDFSFKVTYPPFNIFENEKSEEFSKKYSVFPPEYPGNFCAVTLDSETIEVDPYLARLSVLMDIYSQCHYAQIDPSLLCFFDAEGKEVKDFFELTKDLESINPDYLTKEQTVYKMLMGEEVPIEEQKKVFKSWKLMKGLSL